MRVHLKGIVELFRWRLPCNDHQWYELFCYHLLTSMSLIVHYTRKRSQFPNYYKIILKEIVISSIVVTYRWNLHVISIASTLKSKLITRHVRTAKSKFFILIDLASCLRKIWIYTDPKVCAQFEFIIAKKKFNYFFEKSPKNLPTNKKNIWFL